MRVCGGGGELSATWSGNPLHTKLVGVRLQLMFANYVHCGN